MKKKALFGGTFDPVHTGHMAVAEKAYKQAGLEGVVFMPCWQSPFKGKTIASGAQRFQMIKSAIVDLGFEQWAEVSDFEINRSERSYSWQTIKHFQQVEPDTQWCWILGTDQWQVIDQWAEPEKLRKWLRFLVFTRQGNSVAALEGWKFQAIEFNHPASASKIRGDFNQFGNQWLTVSVQEYCSKQGLYIKK